MIKYVIVERHNFSGRYIALRGLQFETEAAAKQHITEKFNERYRDRYHVESRQVKEDEETLRMTCQCCGRKILAKTGSIAHHGYERPGHGWQTSSCFGAKRLPWEVDRAAVADLIGFLKSNLKNQIAARKAVADETSPVTHHYSVYDRFTGERSGKTLEFTRATFDELKTTLHAGLVRGDGYYENKTFDQCKERDLAGRDNHIKKTKADIVEFTKRYDGWKQTHKRHGNDWVLL
jgi:hypothetical protein